MALHCASQRCEQNCEQMPRKYELKTYMKGPTRGQLKISPKIPWQTKIVSLKMPKAIRPKNLLPQNMLSLEKSFDEKSIGSNISRHTNAYFPRLMPNSKHLRKSWRLFYLPNLRKSPPRRNLARRVSPHLHIMHLQLRR
jgi:hypothetical protein